jgi:hypothetical protein
MTVLFGLISGFGILYVLAIWHIADALDAEEERQKVEQIESVGGEDSPWINPKVSTQTHVDTLHIPDMVRVYPQSQMPRSVPESVPDPVPMSRGLNHFEPRGSGVQVQDFEPVHEPVQEQGSEDWLEQNQVYFPLEVPPDLISSDAGLKALEEAKRWINKALAAGVSQTKIATEMFGAKKGGNKAYLRIVNLVKEVRNEH